MCVLEVGRGGVGRHRGRGSRFSLLASSTWCFFNYAKNYTLQFFPPAPPSLPFGILLSGGPSLYTVVACVDKHSLTMLTLAVKLFLCIVNHTFHTVS